jgi:hypothetical protein
MAARRPGDRGDGGAGDGRLTSVASGLKGRRALAAIVCLGLLGLAGCTSKLDTDKIESGVKGDLAKRTGARITSVKCPDEVDAKKGDRFTCTAQLAGGATLPIEVIQTDDKGSVTWRIGRP